MNGYDDPRSSGGDLVICVMTILEDHAEHGRPVAPALATCLGVTLRTALDRWTGEDRWELDLREVA